MSKLRDFVSRIAQSVKEPGDTVIIPKDQAVLVARFVNTRIKAASAGGKNSHGHRWKNRKVLSRNPRAVKMRELRARRKQEETTV